jgi:coiled-coil domain-containing protein 55
MVDFHKKMLMEKERRHQEAVDAAAQAAKTGFTAPAAEDPRQKSEAEVIEDLRKQGKNVLLNEEGQVADRSTLLSAGLNIIAKPKPPPATTSGSTKSGTSQPAYQPKSGRQAQRERQTQMVMEQIEQANKRKADEEAEEQARVLHAAKSQKTATEISSAKERYLQRKREKEAAAAAAKAAAGK